MDHRVLDCVLEAFRRLGVHRTVGHQVVQLRSDTGEEVAPQFFEINIARAHGRGSVPIVDEREQQVFKRRIFTPALVGEGHSSVQRPLKA